MKKAFVIVGCVALIITCVMCRKANPAALNDDSRFDPRLSGGAATFLDFSSGSFSSPIDGLSDHDSRVHAQGDAVFGQPFVSAPAPHFGGLGPAYNNTTCTNCHHNDGFGLPSFGALGSSLLLRISIPGTDEYGGPLAAPGFGLQVQNVALIGVQPEAHADVSYTEQPFTFSDGEQASLRTPTYTLSNPYIALPSGYMLSPRLGPPVFGLGLLELIPEATILANADPNDANGDGIKGHANYVYDPYTKKQELGRFGLKANTPTLLLQVATAFQQDMGITSSVQPRKSVWGQSQMAGVTDTSGTDIADSTLNAVVFYIRTLAVPGRRDVTDPTVMRGQTVFTQLNCTGCHTPTVYTGVNTLLPALSNQRIHPYTDMLLHDMGADLADNRPDYLASGTEWRTPPLWGLGLFEKTSGIPYYLHDGRARTITEAILWHGGEAKTARDNFTKLPSSDRKALLAFLQSL